MSSEIDISRRRIVRATALTALGSLPWGLLRSSATKLPFEGYFPSLRGGTAWLNSAALESNALRGRVVLIDFWTYSCINWRRSFPYVSAWAQKYRKHGLVVIGVHSPEFPFEADIDNVQWAVNAMRVDYAVAIDNDYAIWRAFNNQFWPAMSFTDVNLLTPHHRS